jgi:hypothetical protein
MPAKLWFWSNHAAIGASQRCFAVKGLYGWRVLQTTELSDDRRLAMTEVSPTAFCGNIGKHDARS